MLVFFVGVIPKARVLTSGPRDLPRNVRLPGDPSLRLKDSFARDDASENSKMRSEPSFGRLLTCLLLLLALSACYSGTRPPRVGSNAPDFTLQDGQNKVTLSQFRGQVVVLNFWATWCPPCVEEMPSLVEMQRRMKAKGVTVVAVSIDVDENAYRQFVKDHAANLLTVRDPQQKTPDLYGTHGWPETYIIDRKGVVLRKFIGPVDWTDPEVAQFLGKL